MFSVLPPNSTCLLIMPTFLMPLYIVNYYPGTCTMETSAWCERCLLITESLKTPGHFRYLIWKRLHFISTGLRRGFSIHLSSPQATLGHAVSRTCVAYDDERFSGKKRLRNRGFRKEYVANRHWQPPDSTRCAINDFVIACANLPVLDAFRKRLLEAFEGTYEGPLRHYLAGEIACDPVAGTPRSFSLRRVSIQKQASRISQLSTRENGSIFPNTNF